MDKADNLRAPRAHPSARTGSNLHVLIVLLALSMILLTFPDVRQIRTSSLA